MDGKPESPRLSSVTVWYRCNQCFGYLHSIPALKKHANDEHGVTSIKLPEGLPPEAIDGRVVCNPVPFVAPRPFRRLTLNPKIIEEEKRRLEAEALNEREPPKPVENQDNGNGPSVRIDVAELHEPDEIEPPPKVQIGNDTLSCSTKNQAVGSTEGFQPPAPAAAKLSHPEPPAATSNASNRRFQCPICNKRFRMRVQLHFHTTRVHPPNYTQKVDSSSSNVPVESPQPGSGGNLKIKKGSSSDSTASGATAKIPRRNPAKRTRQPSSSSGSSGRACTPKNSKSLRTSSEKKKTVKDCTLEESSGRLLTTYCATKHKMQNKITSESESSDKSVSTSPQPRKKRLRSSTQARPSMREFSENESVSSPEVPKPRLVKKKAASISKVPDSSSESASDVDGSEDGSEEDPEQNETNESEETSDGELTDRSTTPESLDPSAQEESNDEDKNRMSDSDDLYVQVVPKSKKKSKKNRKQTPDTSTETTCKMCEEKCESTAALVRHVEKHHVKPNSRVHFVCGFCRESYTTKEMFNRHIVTHNIEQTNYNDKLD